MQESVKRMDSEPIIRFLDVCKTFKYHGGASRFADIDEDGGDEAEEEEESDGPKRGETRIALQNIDFSIMPGERVGIIGGNGSGKSTLLKIVAGMSLPTSGRVVGRGLIVPLDQVTRPLNATWDGYDNLRMLARLLGFPPEKIDERSRRIASFADMEDAISEPVSTYSRGMYARLAFAAALELDGDIYISDDVLGVGDQAYQAKCYRRLVELCEFGKTLLFATHRLQQVGELCTRAIWLRKGQVQVDAQPVAVIESYRASMIEEQQASLQEAQASQETETISLETWFREKYGFIYPLPVCHSHWCRPIDNDSLTWGDPALGGISELVCVHQGEANQIIADNETFLVRFNFSVPHMEVKADIMLEVVRGKILHYQSLLADTLYLEEPQTLSFEIPINSRLLPDGVYLIRIKAVLTRGSDPERLVSAADLYVATNNCGPDIPQRSERFTTALSPWRTPIQMLDLEWRVIERQANSDEIAAALCRAQSSPETSSSIASTMLRAASPSP